MRSTQRTTIPGLCRISPESKALLVPQVIAFDLDETMYPRSAGVMQAIGQRITLYLEQFMGLTTDEALALRRKHVVDYGTTLRGLQIENSIDSDQYMEFVHDVPVEDLVHFDPRLDRALESIDAQKIIFTNASREHAERVLAALGMRRHFARIIDVRDADWVCKPHREAYVRLLALLDLPAPRCLLVEDNVRNLRPAAAMGLTTVLVDAAGDGDAVDFVIDEIWQIGAVYQSLKDAA